MTWLRVRPEHPRVVYAGGYRDNAPSCTAPNVGFICSSWALRSPDGGATWQRLDTTLAALDEAYGPGSSPACGGGPRPPLLLAPDGLHVYAIGDYLCSANESYSDLLRSVDGGLHWHAALLAHQGEFYTDVSLSPLLPSRVYSDHLDTHADRAVAGVLVSDDGGAHWRDLPASPLVVASDPRIVPPGAAMNLLAGGVVGDPVHPATLYAGLVGHLSCLWP